jgi:hypothetical protein
MGYRSDFVLIIHGDDDRGFNPLAKLYVWMHQQAECEDKQKFESGWYNFLLENVEKDRSVPQANYLFFSDTSSKMYSFDVVRDAITTYVEDVLNLEWEYVRIGEDTDDNESCSSGNCDHLAFISRSIVVN